MSEHDLRMERYRNSVAHDEIGYRVDRLERYLRNRIESVEEEGVTFEQLKAVRLELLDRQNRMFRALARELRKLKEGKP